jgi:hypothetical protein
MGLIKDPLTKFGDFVVDFLLEFEAIFKKALTRVSGAYGSCFIKQPEVTKISCEDPCNETFQRLFSQFIIQTKGLMH